jgi:hypothetical protein
MITDKDKRSIKFYKNINKWLSGLIVFLLIFFVFQQWYLTFKFIPIYEAALEKHPKLQEFVLMGIFSVRRFFYIWPAILMGILCGQIISNKKLSKLLDRLQRNNLN